MLTAEAVVQTPDPDRYLARLREHTGKMGTHLGHRPRRHASGGMPPEMRHAEWSANIGTVTMNWGQWTVQATAGTLSLRAEAADAENLRRIQDMLATRLEAFGRREHLMLTWQPPGTPANGPAATG
jgi:hypothetical protein